MSRDDSIETGKELEKVDEVNEKAPPANTGLAGEHDLKCS
jgi:hypothetical protein